MYGLRMKMSGHHLHMPNRHAMAVRMSHMVHSQLFWPLVAVAFLLGAVIGLIIIGALIIIAIAAPHIATHDPILSMSGIPGETGRLPGKVPCIPIFGCEEATHIMGLDLNGRDLFSRVIFGTRTSLFVT